jgi:hypothetical protein
MVTNAGQSTESSVGMRWLRQAVQWLSVGMRWLRQAFLWLSDLIQYSVQEFVSRKLQRC